MGTRLDPISELNHYYKDTILSINAKDIKLPFYANEFYTGTDKTYIECSGSISVQDNNKNFMWAPQIISADEINYEYPDMGYFNLFKCAYYAERIPERQYKKGMSDRTLVLSRKANVLEYIEMQYGRSVNKINEVEKWYSILNPKFYSVDELISKIETEEIYSGAFCNKYAIQPVINTNNLIIMYKYSAVGYLKNKIGIISKNNEHLVESLSEYMKVEVL